jgi:hypothetical protein
MFEVMASFPNVAALRSASPAQLGMVALRGFVNAFDSMESRTQSHRVTRNQLVNDIVNGVGSPQITEDIRPAAEAVAWLITHDLVAERLESNGTGWLFPTRLGREILETTSARSGGAALALRAVDLLPPEIRTKVVSPLFSGDFDLAVTAACKAVEVRMRERAGLPTSDFGRRLAKKFFALTTSTALQRPDQHGIVKDEVHLFEGIFGLYRDRAVHEAPHIASAEYALEVIIAAAHLLRIVDSAVLNLGGEATTNGTSD